MKLGHFRFLKPQLLNVLLTIFVLWIPLLREQYNNGQLIAWYRPIDLIISSLTQRGYFQLFFPFLFFAFIVYLFISVLILAVSKIVKRKRF